MKSKNIALVYRPDVGAVQSLAISLIEWLKERKHKVFIAPEQKKISSAKLITKNSDLKNMDFAVVLGGDGTYLRAVRVFEKHNVPILGINFGSLGFLTATRAEDLFSVLEQTLTGKTMSQSRSMLEVQVKKSGKVIQEALALNDIVIERGSLSQLINLEMHVGKKLINTIKADGLIISSPTGSTAYNLAAGGPILHPSVKALLISPIAPHSLTSRPLLFPDTEKLRFVLTGKIASKKDQAHLVSDGQKILNLNFGDEINIQKAKRDHLMIQQHNYDYFDLLRQKLKFGDRS